MQRTARDSVSVPVGWTLENMGKAYVEIEAGTYITLEVVVVYHARDTSQASRSTVARPNEEYRLVSCRLIAHACHGVPARPWGKLNYTLFGWL
jgi:hypothetical protein